MLRSIRTSTPEPNRQRRPAPIEAIGLVVWGFAAIGVLLSPEAPARANAILLFIAIAPGLAVTRLVGIGGLARLPIAVAISLSVATLIGEGMAYAERWTPELAALGLVLSTMGLAVLPHAARWLEVIAETPPQAAPSVGASRVREALESLGSMPVPYRIRRSPIAADAAASPVDTIGAPAVAHAGWRAALDSLQRGATALARWFAAYDGAAVLAEPPAEPGEPRALDVLGVVEQAPAHRRPASPMPDRPMRATAHAVADELLVNQEREMNSVAITGEDQRLAEALAMAVGQAIINRSDARVHLVQIEPPGQGAEDGLPAPAGLEAKLLMYEYFRSRRPLGLERYAVKKHAKKISSQGDWLVAYGPLDGAQAVVWLATAPIAVLMADREATGEVPDLAQRLFGLGVAEVAVVLTSRSRPLTRRFAEAWERLSRSPRAAPEEALPRATGKLRWVKASFLPTSSERLGEPPAPRHIKSRMPSSTTPKRPRQRTAGRRAQAGSVPKSPGGQLL